MRNALEKIKKMSLDSSRNKVAFFKKKSHSGLSIEWKEGCDKSTVPSGMQFSNS